MLAITVLHTHRRVGKMASLILSAPSTPGQKLICDSAPNQMLEILYLSIARDDNILVKMILSTSDFYILWRN